MEVQRISDTVQKFNGESYYRCGQYYQRKGKRLHRTVWEYYNGEIPCGYHIHHIDGDKNNNSIDNLTLVTASEHLSNHMSTEERKELSREAIKKAIKHAPAWHKSEEGRNWHSNLAKTTWKTTP